MNSKQRVKIALKREGLPDRVPLQFDLCAELLDYFSEIKGIPIEYSRSYYEDLTYRISANNLRTEMGSDCVVVGGGLPADYEIEKREDGTIKNEFGMKMRQGPLYMEVVSSPLSTIRSKKEAEKYTFPDPQASGRFARAEQDIREYSQDYFIIGDCELTAFELAWHLVGMEKFLRDMITGKDYVDILLEKATRWSEGIATELVKRGVDAIWFGDDIGTQTGLLISPKLWREKLKPLYKQLIAKVKSVKEEVLIIFHSDGAVAPLLDDFIEIGVDVFNPVQPNVSGHDPRILKERFGDRLSFFGSIDQQKLLPEGDPEDIEAEVKDKMEVLGQEGGFMIAPAHIIQSDTPPENVEAFINAVINFGRY